MRQVRPRVRSRPDRSRPRPLRPPAGGRRLVDVVHRHAHRHPDRAALVHGDDVWSYRRLSAAIRCLAVQLRRHGVRPGSLVVVELPRSALVLVVALAVNEAGGAYCIVEPAPDPAARVRRLRQVAPDLVVTDVPGGPGSVVLRADGERGIRLRPRRPAQRETRSTGVPGIAYVQLTSGSTGSPKGVLVTHANVRHYTQALLARLSMPDGLRYAHVTTLAADLGNTVVFLGLWTAGSVHLLDERMRRDPAALLGYLAENDIDVVKSTPSHWRPMQTLVDGGPTGPLRLRLRLLLLGGETLGVRLAADILASGVTGTLVNHYGPTETTVGVTVHELRGSADLAAVTGCASVPVGLPFGRAQVYVETADGALRRRSATGELLVAGPGVARGYLRDRRRTAAAFVRRAGVPGRLYRTGDRVRVDAAGRVEFLGRADRQVKIAGHRVELGEVEAALRRIPWLRDVVVVRVPGPRPALGAAVVADPGHPADGLQVRRAARRVLAPHLVPERFLVCAALPQTANGKADTAALEAALAARPPRPDGREPVSDDAALSTVRTVWQEALGHGDFTADDAFSETGGNSIEAIQVIAALQHGGHRVGAADMIADPSPRSLAELIRRRADARERPAADEPEQAADDAGVLSAAQRWFFRQSFAAPDQWNQAMLLEVDPGVDLDALRGAFDDLVDRHAMLRTAFRPVDGRWRRVAATAALRPVLRTSRAEGGALEEHLLVVSTRTQRRISVERGPLFAAHLTVAAGRAYLFVACHHLAVDVVSWRILLSELNRRYGMRLDGEPGPVGVAPSFGAWATSVAAQADELRADLSGWADLAEVPAVPSRPENLERDTTTAWFGLSSDETDALVTATARAGTSLPAALLAALCLALAERGGPAPVVVDVESHGRAVLDGVPDPSAVVGWFTSTFPLPLDTSLGDARAVAKSAADGLAGVPHQGIAYGLLDQPRRADVCFNYVGSLTPPPGRLGLRPATEAAVTLRGPANDRVYGLKVTARLHRHRLVVDVAHAAGDGAQGALRDVAAAMCARLLDLAERPPRPPALVVQPGSTTGLFGYLPRALAAGNDRARPRTGEVVLLTGATGFVGAHVLRELLDRTDATVVCLVRGTDVDQATARLCAEYAWHHREPAPGPPRLTVLVGDLTRPRLGLDEPAWSQLATDVDSVYHCAGDTRLFGDAPALAATNTRPLETLIALASTGRSKDLHHVSTLAVSGEGRPGAAVVFSEDSLDIGQVFRNGYERSKFDAELLMAGFLAGGGRGFVYRPGNVSGHSGTGRFQRNAAHNRLVQLLRAFVKIGKVPDMGAETEVLSPVDVVAASIVEIARDPALDGGTFHVDSPHAVTYEELFAALRRHGVHLDVETGTGLGAFFERHLDPRDEDLALAHFWAGRPDPRVSYSTARTCDLLGDHGITFPRPREAWVHAFVGALVGDGTLATPNLACPPNGGG